jgi:DNA replication protein DnaC
VELKESIEQIVHAFAKERIQPLGEERVCPSHGSHESFKLTYLGRTATVNSCPKCLDVTLNTWKEEAARDFIEKIEGIIQKNIPRRFWSASIESFQTPFPQMEGIKRKIKGFISSRQGKSLVMIGKPGTGKTHLGYAIYKHLLISTLTENGIDVMQRPIFATALDIIRDFKECWRQCSPDDEDQYRPAFISERQALTHYGNTPILIVDEVGVGFQSETEKLILTEIINYRYERMLPIVLISNLEPSQLTNVLGERVIDRLKEGEFLIFDWGSWRRKENSYQPNSKNKNKNHGKAN